MPAFARVALLIFARDRRIELDHRFAPLDRRVRSTGDDRTRFDKALPRVSPFEPFHTETTRCEVQIADRVRRLHRRNHTELRESWDIDEADDLSVLDSPARLANLALLR